MGVALKVTACIIVTACTHCNSVHQLREHGKGGSFIIYFNDSFNFKVITDLSVNNNDFASTFNEILFEINAIH